MIFVTGGTGLVGAHLIYELLLNGEKVKALKRPTSNLNKVLQIFSYYSSNPKILFDRIEWIDGDILDYFGLEKILHGVESVYHCAAVVSFQSSERKKMIENNVEGTSNIVNASIANGVKKFCHVSSIAALGRLPSGYLVNEETKWIPSKKNSGYSDSKFYSELEVWRGVEEGLDSIIVNPSIILGSGNWESGSSRFFKTIWDGLKFFTKGETGYVSVKDVVKAMILLMGNKNFRAYKNQRYLLNAENIVYQDFFNLIADSLDKPRSKYYASDLMLGIVWRFSTLGSMLVGKPSPITREAVSGSNKINRFDGSKITKCIDFTYSDISETIEEVAKNFLSDQNNLKP